MSRTARRGSPAAAGRHAPGRTPARRSRHTRGLAAPTARSAESMVPGRGRRQLTSPPPAGPRRRARPLSGASLVLRPAAPACPGLASGAAVPLTAPRSGTAGNAARTRCTGPRRGRSPRSARTRGALPQDRDHLGEQPAGGHPRAPRRVPLDRAAGAAGRCTGACPRNGRDACPRGTRRRPGRGSGAPPGSADLRPHAGPGKRDSRPRREAAGELVAASPFSWKPVHGRTCPAAGRARAPTGGH